MDEVKGDAGLAGAFDQAAPRYDLLTGLNPGYHRHLDAAARQLAERLGPDPGLLLDLGCGSGSSTAALLRHAPSAKVVGVDASAGMLAQARSKRWPAGVEFHHLPAQQLADLALPQADGALAAYLLRNLSPGDRDRTLAVILGRLRPGGWLVVQEYSVAGNPRARRVWDTVCSGVIIPLGILVDRNRDLYRYLWRSVRDFDSVEEFAQRLLAAGFTDVAHRTASGWQRGVLHTFVARKPDTSR